MLISLTAYCLIEKFVLLVPRTDKLKHAFPSSAKVLLTSYIMIPPLPRLCYAKLEKQIAVIYSLKNVVWKNALPRKWLSCFWQKKVLQQKWNAFLCTGVGKIIDPLFVLTKNSYPISKKHLCIDHLCASNVQWCAVHMQRPLLDEFVSVTVQNEFGQCENVESIFCSFE